MTGLLTISSSTISYPAGTTTVGPLQVNAPNPVLQVNELNFLSATFISTAGPVGATFCVIVPPSGSIIQLTLKGITGDTGIPISASMPSVITFFSNSVANGIGLASAAAIPAGPVTLTWC